MRTFSYGLFGLGVVVMVLSWEGLSASDRGALVGLVLCLAGVLVRVDTLATAKEKSTDERDRASTGT